MEKLVIGIDVSKEKLDVCLFDGHDVLDYQVIANNLSCLQQYVCGVLLDYNLSCQDILICGEYTGHYIYPLCLLSQQGYRVWIENPSQIKYRSGISRVKNDKVDARKIAFYCWRYRDQKKIYSLSDESLFTLKELRRQRDLYIVDHAKYQAQLKDQKDFISEEQYAQNKKRFQKVIGLLNELISDIDKDIEQIIAQDKTLSNQYKLLTSIVGVGPLVATKMIIATNAFKDFNNARKFCSHAGVAPFEHQSGSSLKSHKRVFHRADKSIKTLLHLASMAAIRAEGEIKEYYKRKIQQGKPKMSVINAIRAKLVLRMFAVIKNNRPYDKNYLFSIA